MKAPRIESRREKAIRKTALSPALTSHAGPLFSRVSSLTGINRHWRSYAEARRGVPVARRERNRPGLGVANWPFGRWSLDSSPIGAARACDDPSGFRCAGGQARRGHLCPKRASLVAPRNKGRLLRHTIQFARFFLSPLSQWVARTNNGSFMRPHCASLFYSLGRFGCLNFFILPLELRHC